MPDRPVGRAADVDRLLQVLAVLRAHELGVRRTLLVEKVDAYREGTEQGVTKMIARDLKALRALGFRIEDLHRPGDEARWSLVPTTWRAPMDLDDVEQGLLAWVFRTSRAVESELSLPSRPSTFDALLGAVPPSLGVLQAALSGRRTIVVDVDGRDRVLEPAGLAVSAGRWVLLARSPGHEHPYGYRVDRLVDVRLGESTAVAPEPVDPLEVLDPTAWPEHDPMDVEVRCSVQDQRLVGSWFPRADVVSEGDEAVLRFSAGNLDAALDRVIGLAGAAWLVAPPEAVARLRERLLPFADAS